MDGENVNKCCPVKVAVIGPLRYVQHSLLIFFFSPKEQKNGVYMPLLPFFTFWRLSLKLTFSSIWVGPAQNEQHLGLQSRALRQGTEICPVIAWGDTCPYAPSSPLHLWLKSEMVREDGKGRPEHLLESISCFGQMVSWPILIYSVTNFSSFWLAVISKYR